MFHGLKGIFHKDKGGQNLLKHGAMAVASQSRRSSAVEDAPRRVRLADISGERSQFGLENRLSEASGSGSRRTLPVGGLASRSSVMETRPLPKRNWSTASDMPAERSAQALALAMMGDGKDVRAEGSVKIASTITTSAEIMCCRFSNNGVHLAVGTVSGGTSIYSTDDVASHVVLLQDHDTLERSMPVTCARFVPVPEPKPSTVLLNAYGDGLVKFWRYMSGECLQTLDVDEQVLALSFDCLGKYFQLAGEDGAIRVFDAATSRLAGRLHASADHALNDGHRSRVFALAAHPHTPHELLSAGWDNTVQFWDMRHPHAVRRIYGPHICGEGLSIDPISNRVVTASWRRRQALQVWDYGSGELITDIQPDSHESMQTGAQFMGQDYLAASGGFVNLVRMIDCRAFVTVGSIRNVPQSVRCQDVSVCADKQFPRIAACFGSEALLIDTWY
ncbi:uncharacterized WD repeat-containing protein C227.12-like [Pollicipes pollicipes]|uniref:uncharacterized WD repeat-containing protein C227.12-like n=1 Tax=Pollicipes pollicipes TaxID=41117 RepID=UPI00188502D7|nr:uncharacterized WD repeat-containing protein C227.12-like [Pollicipes pollicipes]